MRFLGSELVGFLSIPQRSSLSIMDLKAGRALYRRQQHAALSALQSLLLRPANKSEQKPLANFLSLSEKCAEKRPMPFLPLCARLRCCGHRCWILGSFSPASSENKGFGKSKLRSLTHGCIAMRETSAAEAKGKEKEKKR